MTLLQVHRENIIQAMLNYRLQFGGTDYQYAIFLGIGQATYNQLKKGKRDRIIRDDKLVRIGRLLGVHMKNSTPWKIVKTDVFEYITASLEHCQENAVSRIFCDSADVGKTTAAKQFQLRNKNVYMLDCSQVKTKTKFIRALAQAAGVEHNGRISEVFADLVYYLQVVDKPLIILDEAGDLEYEAWLEIKALWNALEGYCGMYMMGADGLAKKIENNRRNSKVGYAEIFRRFGSQYMSVVNKHQDKISRTAFFRKQAEMVAYANLPKDIDYNDFVKKLPVESLTRLKENIQKAVGKPQQLELLPSETADA
jgi:hypothetical protein